MTTLFVSDLHLCPTRPQATATFLAFLAGPARAAQALYVLGDLFDYWIGDDGLDEPFLAGICEALAALAAAGVPGFFLHGNRDFLASSGFAARSRLALLDDPVLVPVAGVPTLLTHGDLLCTDDLPYQQLRGMVRNPAWQRQFLAQPLAERRRQAEALRQRSEQAKSAKAAEIMDANDAAIATMLRAHGYPRLIHGHTHRPGRHLHVVDGHACERWVLADWYAGGSCLACDGAGCLQIAL
jgi:UDP-2,3-diacylglucosamine hydrolase